MSDKSTKRRVENAMGSLPNPIYYSDDYIASLLIEEATLKKRSNDNTLELLPKAKSSINKTFLSNTIKSVESHNQREEVEDCWREYNMKKRSIEEREQDRSNARSNSRNRSRDRQRQRSKSPNRNRSQSRSRSRNSSRDRQRQRQRSNSPYRSRSQSRHVIQDRRSRERIVSNDKTAEDQKEREYWAARKALQLTANGDSTIAASIADSLVNSSDSESESSLSEIESTNVDNKQKNSKHKNHKKHNKKDKKSHKKSKRKKDKK